jgi:hypothetical protein
MSKDRPKPQPQQPAQPPAEQREIIGRYSRDPMAPRDHYPSSPVIRQVPTEVAKEAPAAPSPAIEQPQAPPQE